ncbi:hypothetical protein [Meiothermus taiwanensis]|uniref:hypothetical protein n=1 Tax=Meiothermus taiwanensis TaxID=172827 RepID=UPI0005B6DDA7|nr:hypothetical protein [Meiothermus taiwanensis]KIQ55840.1 hypothetical protein SY28_01060 [Meiothermus taiwanensis]
MIELTELGLLSLAALALGLLAGGQLVGWGFSVALELNHSGAQAYLTPTTIWRVEYSPQDNILMGFNLAGTTVYFEPARWRHLMPTDALQTRRAEVERYELGHTQGWKHFGLGYLVQVLAEACTFDPKAGWAGHCPNQERPPYRLVPRTGAIKVVMP